MVKKNWEPLNYTSAEKVAYKGKKCDKRKIKRLKMVWKKDLQIQQRHTYLINHIKSKFVRIDSSILCVLLNQKIY